MDSQYDIAVIGGGLVGKAAAFAAAQAGFSVVHIAPAAPPDRRTSALMGPSVDLMQKVGLIRDPAALGVPLSQIRIIDATGRLLRAPETLFDAAEFDLEAFGWNFANIRLGEAFDSAGADLATLDIRQTSLAEAQRVGETWHLTLEDGTACAAKLLVGADGKGSKVRKLAGIGVRQHDFKQAALVCDLELERPIGACSVEFHYPNGPFTLVPAGGARANLVWIDTPETLNAARANPDALATALAQKSQRLFGKLVPLTGAHVFPLSSIFVNRAGKDAAVLVGEAAHAFPPIGAQGFNLGLRDVADLLRALDLANRSAYGWAGATADKYAHMRAADLMRTGTFVDTLFRSLLSDHLPAQALRTVGLWTLKTVPPLRRFAIGFGMGRS
ncbi:FAD-dependent monooxygenase [Pelagibacterium xiamenense]|uniref:FAD-dependent monooxygenase n=1 Tax=Pelagibacterium xiamenense TaxID=2901140 RepID=UPI001E52AEB2|nr:FAD-dependent monooxygenase [Pelagibacterium xiamenense]MCD7061032.1 FAD-dependent monooxygenase [Pelagibacterium xiamenense]